MMQGILEHSKDAAIFCLIHKMDLVPAEQRDKVFKILKHQDHV